ncbi:MAG: glycerophosphodiester phosphodiesterase [Muribaculaceae bacterium]|nr:glycerophosphodiester phosphodiesterase [Muribaculaceae bacterium]
MNKFKHFSLVLLAATAFAASAVTPKVIAHRGYWRADGSAQNSIRSLVKADSIGCYASEFDVWMTSDSVLVVNHDSDINGIIIETSPSDIVLSQKLGNGETVPTLDAYLATASELPIRLVCELKTHNSRGLEKEAVKQILKAIEQYGLTERTDYITFSKDGFKNFIAMTPETSDVYFLNGDYVPEQIKFEGGKGIDYSLKTLKKHPEWIEQSHDLGLLVNVWTVDKESDMKWCIDHDVDFITTNEPELLQKLLKERSK